MSCTYVIVFGRPVRVELCVDRSFSFGFLVVFGLLLPGHHLPLWACKNTPSAQTLTLELAVGILTTGQCSVLVGLCFMRHGTEFFSSIVILIILILLLIIINKLKLRLQRQRLIDTKLPSKNKENILRCFTQIHVRVGSATAISNSAP